MADPLCPGAANAKRMLASLSPGEDVSDIFIVASAQLGQSRNGPYWRLELRDASGAMHAKIWSPQSRQHQELPQGCAVAVQGRVGSYRDRPELVVESLRVLTEEEKAALSPALFMAASPYDPALMLEELRSLAARTLKHRPWRRFMDLVLGDAGLAARLCAAPAAKGMHHAYAGGLLEHTLAVAGLCMRISDQYPELDRQTLFAGAVCHDLGKIWELTPGFAIEYTTEGRLIGHITLVLERLAPYMKKSGLEPELCEHLRHLILSHHGSHEFGSPRLPATAEALVLHYADNLDAKLQQVRAALDGVEEGGWSSYNPPLERFLHRAPRSPEAPPRARGYASGPEPKTTAAAEPLPLLDVCSSVLKE